MGYAIFVSAGLSYVQRPLRQHTETVAALSSALFRFCALDIVACSKLYLYM